MATINKIYRLLSFGWAVRAASRGPKAFAAYLMRRQLRKLSAKQINKIG